MCGVLDRILDEVAVETRSAAAAPVSASIVLRFKAGAHQTIKRVVLGIEHDADVSGPGDQVARLRTFDANEIRCAAIQIERAGVGVVITGVAVDLVDDVGAIFDAVAGQAMAPGGVDDGALFLER